MKKTLLLLCLASTAVFAQKKDFDEKELMSGKTPKNIPLYSSITMAARMMERRLRRKMQFQNMKETRP